MADFRPFKAWRYNPEKVSLGEVIAPPYDVISPDEQDRLYEVSAHNCIRLILNRIETSDDDSNNRYTRARNFFEEWCEGGVLVEEKQPGFYLYRQVFKDPVDGKERTRSALLGRTRLEPFENGVVIPHEKTLSKPRADRNKLLKIAQTNFSPIFGLFEDPDQEISRHLNAVAATAPLYEAADKAEVHHALWVISDEAAVSCLSELFQQKKIYIADGHHRYTSSLEHAEARRAELGLKASEETGSDFTLMALVAFEDEGLFLGPTHRMVRPYDGFSEAEALKSLETIFSIEGMDAGELVKKIDRDPAGKVPIGLVLPSGAACLLTLADPGAARKRLPAGKSDFWYELDVNLVSHLILGELWKLPQEDWESTIFYTHDAGEALQCVQQGKAVCAFLLPSPKVHYLSEMGKSAELMPQKSTYFFPKLASGLVFYHHQSKTQKANS